MSLIGRRGDRRTQHVEQTVWTSILQIDEPQPRRVGAHRPLVPTRMPTPGKEPVTEGYTYKGDSWDDLRPHMWNYLQAVRTRKPVVEDAVFGHNAALACHMANESYFRKASVVWDAASNQIKS